MLVTMERRIHLFPSRTQKLSFSSPKILDWRRSGKIGHCRRTYKKHPIGCFFVAMQCPISALSVHCKQSLAFPVPSITHFASLKFYSPSKILGARSQVHCRRTICLNNSINASSQDIFQQNKY